LAMELQAQINTQVILMPVREAMKFALL
jgi:hypothetical protein